jgi:SAM-dependent methyltransferase
MRCLDQVHERYVYGRRVRVLASALAEFLPPRARVLDVGCGDGLLASLALKLRPDSEVQGIDVLARDKHYIPVTTFDGRTIPHPDASFDVVTFIDVLHHADDPRLLLREAARVGRQAVIVKDHLVEGFLAGPTLRFMDRVGNARYHVSLPFNYWPREKWRETFVTLGLAVEAWRENLRLYPWWADWVFGRSLHFVARLKPRPLAR